MTTPLLHVVTGDAQANRPDFPDLARTLLEAWGGDLALHLRLREATGAHLFELAAWLARTAERTGGWCAVNERLDVAIAAGTQAVQLGRTALPVAIAREVIRRARAGVGEEGMGGAGGEVRRGAAGGPTVGASVHSEWEARQAIAEGADYLVLGTIFASRSHPGVRPHGTAIVEACRRLGSPVIAIGGVDAGRAPELRHAGASGMAVVRAVWDAERPVEAAGRLIRAWRAA